MLLNFYKDTDYIMFLDFLKRTCDNFKIIYESEIEEFIMQISSNLLEVSWTRKFPGCGREGTKKVLHYKFDERIVREFQKYVNIFEVGYNQEEEIGIDFAFYKESDLICFVINHEEMCYIERPFEKCIGNSCI